MKNIIFDLGGVILNIDYKKTSDAFQLLNIDKAIFYNKREQHELFNQLEKGKIKEEDFINRLQVNKKESRDKILNAWNAMLLDLPSKRLKTIKSLKKNYKIFLLSNTNSIHIKKIKENLGKNKWKEFINLFDKIYLSHIIGKRKPNTEVFNLIIKENNLQKEETLFIDDSIQHINAGRKIGINCYHLKKGEDIITLFPDIIQSKHH